MPHVADLLRARRQQRGLTLSQLADAVDAAPSYLSMIENRRVENPPSAALLDRLEIALGIHDRALQDAADWQLTPPQVRAAVTRYAHDAERGRKLAVWLKLHTGKAKNGAKGHGGRDLDHLYRTGQLSRRINAVLEPEPDGPVNDDAPRDNAEAKTEDDLGPALPMLRAPRVPLINRVAAGQPATFTDLDFPARVADDYLAVPGLDDPDAFATRVYGASMSPDYAEGDIVVFSPTADVTDGCDAFVRLEPEHDITFKRVYFDQPDEAIRLQPLNSAFAPRVVPRDHVAGLYKAVWRFAKL